MAVCSFMVLIMLGAPAAAAAPPAVAGDSIQVATTTPPAAGTAEKGSAVEAPHSAPAPSPPPSAPPDSIVAGTAVKDSAGAAPAGGGAQAKDAPQVEHTDAEAAPPGKTPEAAIIPAAAGSLPESAAKPPKANTNGPGVKARPKGGTHPVAVQGLKSAPKTPAVAGSTPSRLPPTNGAAPSVVLPHDGPSESDRVSAELERTDRFVGRAQRSFLISKNARAMKLFTSAIDFQSDSRDAYKVRQYARAERLTLAARDFADRASRMVGPPREDPDYVEHIMRRTDDALERTKDVLRNGASRDAWHRHDELRSEQKEAWKTFKGGEIGLAYKQTLDVREGVLALLRQLQDLPVPRETAEKAIGGAQAALEQANKELGPKPNVEAVRLVRLASEYLAKARQSFQRGSYRSALLQAKVVERHAEHAVDVGRPRSS